MSVLQIGDRVWVHCDVMGDVSWKPGVVSSRAWASYRGGGTWEWDYHINVPCSGGTFHMRRLLRDQVHNLAEHDEYEAALALAL